MGRQSAYNKHQQQQLTGFVCSAPEHSALQERTMQTRPAVTMRTFYYCSCSVTWCLVVQKEATSSYVVAADTITNKTLKCQQTYALRTIQ